MPLDNVRNIVLILSGKGGVGKSSITTQLALSLSLAGHSVGILDVDLTGPSIPRLFGLESAKITQAPGGWLPVRVHESQILDAIPSPPPSATVSTNGAPAQATESTNGATNGAPAQATESANGVTTTKTSAKTNGAPTTSPPTPLGNDGTTIPVGSLHLMSLGFLLPSRSSAVVWRGPKKTAMVRQFLTDVLWPPIDYLLIDTPPGTSDEHISLAETLLKVAPPTPSPPESTTPSSTTPHSSSPTKPHLAGAVIVTTPQAISTADVRKELNFCKKVGIEILGVVENMSGYVCECCGEATDIFGKGGGESMSRDFGVRFLGGVPVDGQWGLLVEEGRRPVYGGVERVEGEDEGDGIAEGEDEERDERGNGGREKRIAEGVKEEGLLVDKYRSCSLSGLFEGIAREVVQLVP